MKTEMEVSPGSASTTLAPGPPHFFFLFCLLSFHLFLHQHPFPGSWSPPRLTPTSLCRFSRYTVSISLPVPPDMKEHQSSHRKVQKREGTTSSTGHALNSNIHIFFFFIYRKLYVNSVGVSCFCSWTSRGLPQSRSSLLLLLQELYLFSTSFSKCQLWPFKLWAPPWENRNQLSPGHRVFTNLQK